jgi:arylsulfatase A-like enzyme
MNIHNNHIIGLFVLLILISCKYEGSSSGDKKAKPNILLIQTDQQRYNTIHALGNEKILTPNLDGLVESGMSFTNSFVSAPVCLPSRWSLHSGMYTTTHQSWSNHHLGPRPGTSLPLELKNAGYQTALMGKNHSFLNKNDLDVIFPTPAFTGRPEDGRCADRAMDWMLEEDPMHILTDSTISLLTSYKDTGACFIWLSYLYPHTPYMLPEPFYSLYDSVELPDPVVEPEGLEKANKPFRQVFHQENNNRLILYSAVKIMRMKRNYYGMVSLIDHEIGRLFDFLEENEMRDNTLIIFTSDHGDYQGDHHMLTKSPAMYDCLTRVPLIFSWPGKIRSNVTTDELISNVDIMPTILSLMGLEIPGQVRGISYHDFLTSRKHEHGPREYVYSEYGIPGKPYNRDKLEQLKLDYKEHPIFFSDPKIPWEANPVALAGRFRMIRSKDWKLVEEENGTSELYDLQNDPNELVNLYDDPDFKDIQQKMLADLRIWKSSLPGIETDTMDVASQNMKRFIEFREEGKNPNMMYSQHQTR